MLYLTDIFRVNILPARRFEPTTFRLRYHGMTYKRLPRLRVHFLYSGTTVVVLNSFYQLKHILNSVHKGGKTLN